MNKILREKQGFCFVCKKFTNIKIEKITHTTHVRDVDITCDKYLGICESCGECCSNENIQRYNDFLAYEEYKKQKGLVTGTQIVEFRKKYKLTQIELAQLLGFGEKSITMYELGKIQDENHDRILKNILNEAGLISYIRTNYEKIPPKIIEKFNFNIPNNTTNYCIHKYIKVRKGEVTYA